LKDIQLPNTFKSNSLHHQAISKLGTGFVDIARTKSFGKSIEAIAHIEKPIIAVQYHPEEIHDEFSINLIKCLLNNNVKQLKLIDKCIC
jgi:gamma-glutamyl-gamma-aminobutyrate hydrolase PuuD